MALPPHIIKKRIDAMPEGAEKEKRLKSFHNQMRFMSVAYPIMMLAALLCTIGIVIVSLHSMGLIGK